MNRTDRNRTRSSITSGTVDYYSRGWNGDGLDLLILGHDDSIVHFLCRKMQHGDDGWVVACQCALGVMENVETRRTSHYFVQAEG